VRIARFIAASLYPVWGSAHTLVDLGFEACVVVTQIAAEP
jgi:hypothetical protein